MVVKKPNPNTGDQIYQRQVHNAISPSGRPIHDYSDDLSDYHDDTPDYSDYDDNEEDSDYSNDESESDSSNNSNRQNSRTASDKLKKSERDYDNNSSEESHKNSSKSDVAKRERQDNYKYSSDKKHSGGSKKAGGSFFQRHKKGIAGSVFGTFAFGGMMSGSMILSGPMQFMQVASMLKKTYNIVTEIQHDWRRMHNMKKMLARSFGKGHDKEGEVGVLGTKSSKGYVESLKKIGLEVNKDGSLRVNTDHIEMKWDCTGSNCLNKQVKRKLGGKESYFSIDREHHTVNINTEAITGEGGIRGAYHKRRFLSDLGRRSGVMPPGKYVATRMTGKSKKFLSIFHPFRSIKNIIKDRIEDLVGAIKDVAMEKFKNSKVYRKGFELYQKTRIIPVELPPDVSKFFGKMTEKLAKLKTKMHLKINLAKVGGTVLAVASMICKIKEFSDQIEQFRWDNHVMPAMQLATEENATASQMRAGRVSMAQLGQMSQHQFYDEYPADSTGNNTKPSSWWDSAPINAELNQTQGMSDEDLKAKKNAVLPQLQNVDGRSPNTFGAVASGIINAINASVGGLACGVDHTVGIVGDWITKAVDFFTAGGLSNLSSAIMGPIMNFAIELMAGKKLDLTNQTPEQFGNIAAYGSKFMGEQNGLRANGGTVLSDTESAELRRDANTWLAMEWNDTPLLAKLFDPTDYRSAISTVARNARMNPMPENILASITNTFRLMAAIPNTAVAMAVDSPVATARAASGRPAYDYGVPDIGIVPKTFNRYNIDNQGEMDEKEMNIFQNARYILRVFWSEDEEKQYIKGQINLKDGEDGVKRIMPLGMDKAVDPLPVLTDENSREFKELMDKWRKTKDTYKKLIHICLAKDIDEKGKVTEDHSQNQDHGGHTFMYLTGTSSNHEYTDNNCKGRLTDGDGSFDDLLARIANYSGPDIADVRTNQCLAGDKSDGDTSGACVGAGLAVGGNGSNGGDSDSSSDGPLEPGGIPSSEMAKRFVRDTLYNKDGIKYKHSANGGSYDSLNNGCTMVPFWFITKYTNLKYCGGNGLACGNGGDVARNLAAANGLKISRVPRPYSIFSSRNGAMSSDGPLGHTGLVTQVDQDGTIHTLEVWFTDHEMHECTYKPSDYANNVDFVYVGDHLKSIPNGPSYGSKMEVN